MLASIRSGSINFISFQRIIGNLLFLVLAIYSILYASERVTYIDSAWQFFYRVNNETFLFPSGRFSVFLSQIPLFIAVKLHLPFQALVYTFSFSYIIIYYFVWRICTYVLKNPVAGLAIILSLVVGIRESFLHPVTETHQCIVFSCFLWAIINYDFKREYLKVLTVCLSTLFILFLHPVGVFTIGFVVLYFIIEKKTIRHYLPWLIIGIILILSLYRFLAPKDPYDAAQYLALKNPSADHSFFNSYALGFLLMHFKHFYWLPELAFLIASVWLIFKKEWLKLIVLVASVTVYLLIAFITFRNGDSSIMLERIYLPAFLMTNIALADLLVREKRMNKWIPMVLVTFFLVNGIRYINTGCLMYKKRVAYLDKIVTEGIKNGNDLYFLSDEKTDMERILAKWALGTETLIYSKFKYDKCISISMKDEICEPGNCRVTNMLCLPVADLNQNYFHLSNSPYVELK